MDVNFPNNPQINDVFTKGDRSWRWTGVYWRAFSTTTGYTGSKGDQGEQGTPGEAAAIGYTGSEGVGFTGSAGANIIAAAANIIGTASTASDIPGFTDKTHAGQLNDAYTLTNGDLYLWKGGDLPGNLVVDSLVVAGGGGGGGANHGAGGGAGGYRTASGFSASPGTNYTVTVGAGGSGGPAGGGGSGVNGSNSVFATITSAGGGFGNAEASPTVPGNGGSGGGAMYGNGGNGGSGNTPNTSPSQGNNGGNGNSSPPNYGSGGGGGADAVGAAGTSTTGGNGGIGKQNSITGASPAPYYAGGGGGSTYAGGTAGSGGLGGGGAGVVTGGNATNGTVNTGGGGGGSERNPAGTGGNGGSGIVIIRYADTAPAATATTGSPAVTVSGGYRVYQFTTSGSFTAPAVPPIVGLGWVLVGNIKGAPGEAAAIGYTGSEGVGFTGSAGAGFTGSAGDQGPIGYTGSSGGGGGGARYINLAMSGEITPPIIGQARFYPPASVTITNIYASISSQASGGDFVFRLNKNGVNTGVVLLILSGSFTMVPVVTSVIVNSNDYLTLDVIGVGSRDLHVKMEYELSI